jgi:tetratricopeptide (TPR) repeat protein
MEIHLLLDGEQLGPFSESEVRKYVGEGLVSPSVLACYDGAADWQSLDQILSRLPPPDPTVENEPALPVVPDEAPADAPVSSAPPSSPALPNEASSLLNLPPQPRAAEPPPPLTATQKTKRKPGRIVIQPILPPEASTSTTSLSPVLPLAPLARKKLKTGKTQVTLEPIRPTTALPPVSSFQPREKTLSKPRTGTVALRDSPEKPAPLPPPLPSVAAPASEPAPTTPDSPPTPSQPDKTKVAAPAKLPRRRITRGLIFAGAGLALLLIGLTLLFMYLISAWSETPTVNPQNAPPPPIHLQTEIPAPEPAANPTTAAEYGARGLARQSAGDIDGAIADFTQAVALDPKDVAALDQRGLAREARGDIDGALADFNQVITLDPKQADAFNNRGLIKQARGDYDGALADYNQALLLDPRIAAAHYNHGLIEARKGYYDAAIADYDHALEIDPKMDQAYYDRGNAKNFEGNLDGALADYTQALTLNPKLADAYVKRGFARQTKGDNDGALADYALAIALKPTEALAYYNRGLIKVQKGDMPGAIDDTTQSIILDPKNASAYCNRGMARFGTGDLDGARSDLTKFCELAPHDGGTDDARVYLWLIGTEQNPQGNADEELSTALLNDWNAAPEDLISKIGSFLLGHIRESELIADAASPDPGREPPQYCKVWYFAGMKRLLGGDMKTAIAYFNKSLATGQNGLCEYIFAQAQLRALGQNHTATAQASP